MNFLGVVSLLLIGSLSTGLGLGSGYAAEMPAPMSPVLNDSDLSPSLRNRQEVPSVLHPDSVLSEPGENGLVLRVYRSSHGVLQPLEGLPLNLNRGGVAIDVRTLADGTAFASCEPGVQIAGNAELRDERFEIVSPRDITYRVAFDAKCGTVTTLLFEEASDAGQALGIWRIARMAETRLSEAVGLKFWKRSVPFIWPGEGDYYSFGQVNITLGQQWDVIGHELGHAIYDMADVGGFGGGEHKIDQCYTERLALSEGWASYFSAWLSVDLSDPDAKFEYMVPRRAPIRFETVPPDVCAGHKSEWRVTAFLWDLIDLNRDSERVEESFARVWNALLGTNVASAVELALTLQKAGFSPELLDLAWELNFLTKRPLHQEW